MITYQTQNTNFPDIPKRKINAWIKTVAQRCGKTVGEIAYIFCSDEKILEINREYLQHNYFTDIITFDYSEKNKISGDIFISLDTVKSNAEKYAQTFEKELYRVIIHGVLHLCGQKDKSAADKIAMTEHENIALSLLADM